MHSRYLLSGFYAVVLCCFSATVAAELLVDPTGKSEFGESLLADVDSYSGHGMKVAMSDVSGFEKNNLRQIERTTRTFSDSGTDEAYSHSNLPKKWFVAEASTTNSGVFGTPKSVVSYQEQTKEWQARTLRTMGIAEMSGGALLALTGLALLSESGLAGILFGGIGVAWAYIGYTDIAASKRFFYPEPLMSQNLMDEEQYKDEYEKRERFVSIVRIDKEF